MARDPSTASLPPYYIRRIDQRRKVFRRAVGPLRLYPRAGGGQSHGRQGGTLIDNDRPEAVVLVLKAEAEAEIEPCRIFEGIAAFKQRNQTNLNGAFGGD